MEADWLEPLQEELSSGRLSVVAGAEPWFAVLRRRFPEGHNRIAWERVEGARQLCVLDGNRQITSAELRSLLSERGAAVSRWFDEEGIDVRSPVLVLGDMAEVALRMTVADLVRLFPVLFSFPQHSYALPSDGSWCLNYEMEGTLTLARSHGPEQGRDSRRR